MDSIPPATMMSLSPALMACAASMTALSPEPHTLFTVVAPTVFGMPALMAACRAGACPTPACTTFPMSTSSTSPGWIPARLTPSRMTTAPSSGAGIEESPPRNSPIAVRQALTMYASRSAISISPSDVKRVRPAPRILYRAVPSASRSSSRAMTRRWI